jgi:hypothetical protein
MKSEKLSFFMAFLSPKRIIGLLRIQLGICSDRLVCYRWHLCHLFIRRSFCELESGEFFVVILFGTFIGIVVIVTRLGFFGVSI